MVDILKTVADAASSTFPTGEGDSSVRSPIWSSLKIDEEESAFFDRYTIDEKRWNTLHPYRLLVIDITKPDSPKIVSSGEALTKSNVRVGGSGSDFEYVLSEQVISGGWEVNLPITPQQLEITDHYAINTTATMRGIVEEHNGIKFKTINMSGTFGIWPRRPTQDGKIAKVDSINTIFAGTLENFGNLTDSIERFTGNPKNSGLEAKLPSQTESTIFSTGYYQSEYLGQFLERYAMAKRRPDWKNYRLALDIPKKNQTYIVTPVLFSLKKDHNRPDEVLFNLQLKAWKRIILKEGVAVNASVNQNLVSVDPSNFQKLVNVVRNTRLVLADAANLIKAVRSDFQRPFEVLRQMTLALKDISGLSKSVADLPNNIIKDTQSSIKDSLITSSDNLTTVNGDPLNKPSNRSNIDIAGSGGFTFDFSGIAAALERAAAILQSLQESSNNQEGLSEDQVKEGALGEGAKQKLEVNPIDDVFSNPEENFPLFDALKEELLSLTSKQLEAIEDEVERVRLLTINDFRRFRQELLDLALDLSDNFGASDPTYSDIYDRQSPPDRPIEMNVEENEVVQSIFETVQVLDDLTSTRFWDQVDDPDPLAFVGGLADDSGIDFERFPSKIPVPVPNGLNIEEIAARYMGDADKWLEIVTLNSLRSPYIDETGFTLDFLSNGDGRRFIIEDTEPSRVWVGQKILLQSSLIPAFSRKIIEIEEVSSNKFLITVDGEADIDSLLIADGAKMKAYLPGTVNSQNQIYIPVSSGADPDSNTFAIPDLSDNFLARVAKVDFLLDDNGDMVINPLGDFMLATGLTNLIQAIKLKIRTKRGSLLQHLDYGLGIAVGTSVADIESGDIIRSLNGMIEDDPRFDSIDRINLRLKGSTLTVDMTIRITNGSGIVPITVNIPVR